MTKTLAIVCASLAMLGGATGAGAEPLNLVFMLIDDQRFDAMGHVNPYFTTPHMDALAANGIVFENAFVTTSLCSPSRASILTGQYAHKHQILDNGTPLPAETPTFPKLLQRAGYETAFIGKWHMGGSGDSPQPGFDRWVSFRGQGVYDNPTLNIDGERSKVDGYVTDLLTDHAVEFITKKRDKPFALYLSHKAVHASFIPAARHKGLYKDRAYPKPVTWPDTDENYAGKPEWVREQRDSWHGVDGMYNETVDFEQFTKDYAETLMAVDDSLGRVMAALKDAGAYDNTLVLFMGDNGFQFGEFGLIDKRTMYEASIRVPLLAHCPALFEGGQKLAHLVANIDIGPTLLDAAGVDVPDTMHGESFLPVMKGEDVEWRSGFLYEYFWERSFPQTPTVLGIRGDRYKFMRYQGIWDRYELYDIQNDPHERHNLLADYEITTEAGQLDFHIRRQAPDDIKAILNGFMEQMRTILDETGGRMEPTWQDAGDA